ncbi:hypothetical protein F2Q69_00050935 [Brassica cretica]|uniref:Zinc finger GRF-type domain-containing protein n=1 Tax=Brassica cretica TaxID=69181 RepID=A0A8S9Q762_BRACR|nr:hypothetical protein F2Q69_00050935 [Brassica cretica]
MSGAKVLDFGNLSEIHRLDVAGLSKDKSGPGSTSKNLLQDTWSGSRVRVTQISKLSRCPCGGRIIDEVRGKDDYDTLPGKRFFTCKNYEADGFHYRQPWVIGVQEHIERFTKRVEEVELVIKWVSEVNNQIERLECDCCFHVQAEVKALNREVDNLIGQVYNLSVQVADLEKVNGHGLQEVDACGRGCLFFISVSLGIRSRVAGGGCL